MYKDPAPHPGTRHALRLLAATAMLAALAAQVVAQQQTPPPGDGKASPELLRQQEEWRIAISQVAPPKQGCFQTEFPKREWTEVACVKGPVYPMLPKRGPRPFEVGNGTDIAARAPSGHISTAIGTFENVSVTSVTSQVGGTGGQVNDAYTIQVNTEHMQNATICAGAAIPANCRVWEQFVFENNATLHRGFIQYWLLEYGNPCPAGQSWISYPIGGVNYCYKNSSTGSVGTTNQPITNLANMSLSGAVSATEDRLTFASGGTAWSRVGDNAVGASGNWSIAEFNILGDAYSAKANFNAGAAMTLRTRIFYGGTAAPTCTVQGFTGETNNLSFGPTAPTASQPGPAVIFRQSTAGGLTGCAAAVTVGDTHLQTFAGLFYDFQASGDFLLAQRDAEFTVQARQVSGAPTWPDTSVNSAVATQMGKSKVAICLGNRLNIDGENREIADGGQVSTADGVDIWRVGNVYHVLSPLGDSIRATVNSSWIDVSVGLGLWPSNVTGLLANPKNSVQHLALRDGTPIPVPMSFETLYGRYGESWRVPAEESLLNACGGEVRIGNPKRSFYAGDLDRETRDKAHAICVAAGVKGDTLLGACTLDVAVLGSEEAAKVYVDYTPPVVSEARVTSSGEDASGIFKKWWWLILLLILLIVFILWKKKNTT